MSDETLTQTTETTTEATTESADGTATSTTSYLDGKYESVSALEGGYKELQSSYSKKTADYNEKMGAFKGAPEGDYELAEGVDSTPRLEALMKYGKDNQLSNEALNDIINIDKEAQARETETYIAEQKEMLGTDAETRLSNISDWARASLGEDSMDAFNGMITSAKGVELMENLMKQTQGTAQAPSQQRESVDSETLKQMRFAKDEFGGRKMSSDPTYRARVEGLEREAAGNR